MIYDVIIVGTGPSGVAAAIGCAEHGVMPLILDVGKEMPNVTPVNENFYNYRKRNDAFELMIGKGYETLDHVIHKRLPSPKISSPFMQFVTKKLRTACHLSTKKAHT